MCDVLCAWVSMCVHVSVRACVASDMRCVLGVRICVAVSACGCVGAWVQRCVCVCMFACKGAYSSERLSIQRACTQLPPGLIFTVTSSYDGCKVKKCLLDSEPGSQNPEGEVMSM